MAVLRLFLIILAIVLVFFGSLKLGEFVTTKILGAPNNAKVPDLIGYSIEEAERILEEAGLKLGEQTEIVNDEYPKGYVVEQSDPEGFTLKLRSNS